MSTGTPAQREAYYHRLVETAATAFTRQPLVERAFRFNGQGLVLRCAGEQVARNLTRALNHLAAPGLTEASLTIDCWDTASTGLMCPLPDWPEQLQSGRGEIVGVDGPEMRIAYFSQIKLVNIYFPTRKRAFYCLADARQFPPQQLSLPALSLLNWWLNTQDCLLVHSAALGTKHGGVLIAGQGGAGKSTLSFSSLDSPLQYISDDFCVLQPGTPPRALSLYSSGKMTEESLGLLPHLRPMAANADDPAREKAIFYLHEQFPGKLLAAAPLRGIVFSQLDRNETSLSPMAWRDVAAVMTGTTMSQLASSSHQDGFRLLRLVQSLPVYRLRHGPDFAATHQLLLNLCES